MRNENTNNGHQGPTIIRKLIDKESQEAISYQVETNPTNAGSHHTLLEPYDSNTYQEISGNPKVSTVESLVPNQNIVSFNGYINESRTADMHQTLTEVNTATHLEPDGSQIYKYNKSSSQEKILVNFSGTAATAIIDTSNIPVYPDIESPKRVFGVALQSSISYAFVPIVLQNIEGGDCTWGSMPTVIASA